MALSRYTVRVSHVLTAEESNHDSVVFSCSFVQDEDYLHHPELIQDDKDKLSKYVVVDATRANLHVFPKKGQTWKISGKNHYAIEKTKNGHPVKEYHMSPVRLKCLIPNSPELFSKLIGRDTKTFAGIGETKATKLWNAFAKQEGGILKVIKDRNVKAISSVKNVSEQDALRLIDGYETYQNLHLVDLLNSDGVPYSAANKMVKNHGGDTGEIYRKNPYILLNFGMPFKTVDKIALNRKDENGNPEFHERDECRLNALIYTLLRRLENQGCTAATSNQLIKEARKLMRDGSLQNASDDFIYDAIDCAVKSKRVVIDGRGYIQSIGYSIIEHKVGKEITRLANTRFNLTKDVEKEIVKASQKLPFKPTDEQIEAVRDAYHFGFSTLGGKAGTGKTAVIKLIIDAHVALGYDVQALALAGKATQEITKATGYPSQTISAFNKNYEPTEEKPLLIIIDEASMVGIASMHKIFLKARVVKMVMVGDGGQLPPVEAGLILHSLIEDKRFKHSFLTKVQRQGEDTGIPKFASSVREGLVPTSANNDHIRFHRAKPEEIIDVAAKLYCQDIDNSQIICAVKDNEHWGVKQLNEKVQSLISSEDKRMVILEDRKWADQEIFEGDPVIFTKNDWQIPVTNGTLGIMQSVARNPKDDDYGIIKLESNGEVKVTFEIAAMIEPAHAMTVHKAQGSHFVRVIIPVGKGFNYDRVWLYTALTRAVDQIEIIGDAKHLKRCIEQEGQAQKRTTCLANYIKHVKAA
ncbi:AAA family ATPase [Photobacterium sp. BZF1]|uniref:AAA family ATPase n=1 Tax=Photobacterium sp. BZF1 TaxID=1904457 RepID=UPI00165382F6|nr:AAA family ATPase [Photobacterium sp. BZF1]MBC7001711.1 AAA family ATPase [Photobacterium sp. BZF1]